MPHYVCHCQAVQSLICSLICSLNCSLICSLTKIFLDSLPPPSSNPNLFSLFYIHCQMAPWVSNRGKWSWPPQTLNPTLYPKTQPHVLQVFSLAGSSL